jgi:hypothetical protein
MVLSRPGGFGEQSPLPIKFEIRYLLCLESYQKQKTHSVVLHARCLETLSRDLFPSLRKGKSPSLYDTKDDSASASAEHTLDRQKHCSPVALSLCRKTFTVLGVGMSALASSIHPITSWHSMPPATRKSAARIFESASLHGASVLRCPLSWLKIAR